MARPEVPQSHDAAEISVETPQAVGKGMWDDVSAWAAHGGRQVQALIGNAPHLPAGLGERAEQVLRNLEARRTRILASLEEQATRLADGVVRRLSLPSRHQIADLCTRISELERRLDTLASQSANQGSLSAVDSWMGSSSTQE